MTTEDKEIDNYRAQTVVQFTAKRENRFNYSPKFFVRSVPWRIYAGAKEETFNFTLLCCAEFGEFTINTEIQISILGTNLHTNDIHKFTVDSSHFGHVWVWQVPNSELPAEDVVTYELKLLADEPEGVEIDSPKKKFKLALQPIESAAQGDDLVSILTSGDFSDVTFLLAEDGAKVKAHKAILAARSKVFARMFASDMKETRKSEIGIDDMGASALKILLRYIYSGQLEFPKEIKVDIALCKELINAGDKYDLPNLKEYAAMALTEFVSFENAQELLMFVKLHKAEAATKALRSYYGRNVYNIIDKW